MAQIADELVVAILLEAERPGADGAAIQQGWRARLQHLLGVFGGEDHRIVAGQGGEEGGVRLVQLEHHRLRPLLAHPLDQQILPQAVEVGVIAAGDIVVGVLLVQLAGIGEDHVIGIESAGGLEPGGMVKCHPLAQGQGIGEAILADMPVGGERRLQRQGVGVHLQQAVVERTGTGIQCHP